MMRPQFVAMMDLILAGVAAAVASVVAVTARCGGGRGGERRLGAPLASRRATNRGGAYECGPAVPPLRVPWKIPYPTYAPACVLEGDDGVGAASDEGLWSWAVRWNARVQQAFRPVYVSISDRRWHAQMGGGCLSSTPRNPSGRTGVAGRGHLPHLGGNAMIVIVSRHGASTFEMMVPVSTDALARLARLTARVLPMCELVHFGFVDHPRNTDNAWVEAAVFVFDGVCRVSPGVPAWCVSYAAEP